MPRTVTGIDIGSRTNKFVRGFYKGNTFHVTEFAIVTHGADSIAEAWSSGAPPFKVGAVRVGLTGRDVNIRYTRVPRVPDWQLRKLMRFEVEEVGGTSGSQVASDFNLLPSLPEIEGEDVVLLSLARESLLDEHMAGLGALGGSLDAFSPCALALYNAWTRYGVVEEETVMLANVGNDNVDVILVRGPDLLFARNLSGGSKLIDAAIAERMGVSPQRAEQLKIEMATLEPGARYRDGNQEKVSRAALAAAGQILSLLQSTVVFCKSQVKVSNLRVDRVLLCGGGSALQGLPRYLSAGLGVPVDMFDPWRVVDASALAPDQAQQLDEYKLESVVSLGLATMASDADAYSIEILPAKVRARREFASGTIYAIAAAVLAVAFLGFIAWRTSQELGKYKTQVASKQAQLRRSKDTDRKTREMLGQNAELAQDAVFLQGVAGSGEQIARVVSELERDLPEGFWIDKLSSKWGFNDQLRVARGSERPLLHLEGKAVEGTESLSALLENLVQHVHAAFPQAEFVYAPSPSGEKFTLDFTLFAPPKPAPADAGADEAATEQGK
jgi:type IV pilus assembly protein PilM